MSDDGRRAMKNDEPRRTAREKDDEPRAKARAQCEEERERIVRRERVNLSAKRREKG